jgi:hypothetical protein
MIETVYQNYILSIFTLKMRTKITSYSKFIVYEFARKHF